jgi:hypothetical protein
MEVFLVPGIALLLIVLLLVLPSGRTPRDGAHHLIRAAMDLVADDTKARLTRLHRAHRADLARAVRHRSATRRMR